MGGFLKEYIRTAEAYRQRAQKRLDWYPWAYLATLGLADERHFNAPDSDVPARPDVGPLASPSTEVLTGVQAIADYLELSYAQVRRLLHSGRIPGAKQSARRQWHAPKRSLDTIDLDGLI